MASIEFSKQPAVAVEADTVAVFTGGVDGRGVPGADVTALGEALGVDLAAELAGLRFDGALGSLARVPTRGRIGAGLLFVVGVGDPDQATLESLRRAAAVAARNATKDAALAVVVPGDLVPAAEADERARAVTEGAGLGAYAFTAYRTKTDDLPSLSRIVVCAGQAAGGRELRGAVEEAALGVRATSLARDLVNEPPAGKRPPALAERAAAVAKEAGLAVRVLDEDALADGGFGGILGVGQGSSAPPRLVEITHDPLRSKGHVVLAGKGITFDSGGLSLKSAEAMQTMKLDMSGAAAVLGALVAVAELGLRVKVTGLLALAENMPSGTAIRVSDVLTHRGGKTVEVGNTDAEGRLVLADTLAYAAESEPEAIVDVATLTGAQVVALGNKVSAVMGSDDELVDALIAAGEHAGEPLWRLPLPEDYREHLNSAVADLRNIGRRGQAGAIIGGLFLSEFTAGLPWAHLDIAGPSFSEEGDAFYTTKGGTGVPVRTLVRFLQQRS